MSNPIILTIDDEKEVLNAVGRDLRQKYGKDYRIIMASSGSEALDTLDQLKQRNSQVALFLSDQRMPGMEGTEFLGKALQFYPDAKKVLLTAYADTSAAISAINDIGLDYYLMKPWSPPEQNLYPVLDDLLEDWQANTEIRFDGIRVAGTMWSANTHKLKDFLARSLVPYHWMDIEENEEARLLVKSVKESHNKLPILFFPDGSTMVDPDITTLAKKVGFTTEAEKPFYDLIIIGAGPAGLASAVYGASEGLKTLLIDKETTGGQAGTSSRIENYLGFPKGLSGADLTRRATAQASRLGAEILTAREATKIRIKDQFRLVVLDDGTELSTHALILATGAAYNKLDVPGIDSLTNAGIYYGAALTEAVNYKDKHMCVVGGANSAGQAAMFFSRYAKKVTMLVRSNNLGKSMSQYLIDQINNTGNIEVLLNTVVKEVSGDSKLEQIAIKNSVSGDSAALDVSAMFIFIGARPYSDLVSDIVERNEAGFIYTGTDVLNGSKKWKLKRDPFLLETSVPGIFAVGDVRNGAMRRVASAVGEGSTAVSFVHQYLKTV